MNKIKKLYNNLSWQRILQNSRALQDKILLLFDDDEKARILRVILKYPFRLNPYYASLIKEKGDPIWLQAIPNPQELEEHAYLNSNPLQETSEVYNPTKNLIHRYPQKAMILTSNICPVYCRHCFRNYFIGHQEYTETNSLDNILEAIKYVDIFNKTVDGTQESFDRLLEYFHDNEMVRLSQAYIDRHKTNAAKSLKIGNYGIRDILLSGGDPLSLTNRKLEIILDKLFQVSGLEVIRIGTRFPVLLPQRFDEELLYILKNYALKALYINTQFNHPNEITPESMRACSNLADIGITVRNQTVLLRGVNDDVRTIKELDEKLVRIRVAPYYLYQTMMTEGTEHLRVPLWKGLLIINQLRGFTAGFSIPTHIVSIPGGRGKVPVPQGIVSYKLSEGVIKLRNYEDNIYNFQDPLNYPEPSIEEKTYLKRISSVIVVD